ncbi:MAG TPA: hypothetical protein VN026_03550 [Bacteroidia bacterium]|jgi:antitoxin component YwqK of YwqJK toxin-antitoxin module|nr:hypothetical protein [Bacteroidia bacterium]
MKKLSLSLFLSISFLLSKAQSYELNPNGKDTINYTDADSKKQGKWIVWGASKNGSCYKPKQIIEEGMYKDNRRIDEWIEYHCNGNIKMKVQYVNGRPRGHVIFYFGNGDVREEGDWINNKWFGKYKMVNENGDVTEIVFDELGNELSKKITLAKEVSPTQ